MSVTMPNHDEKQDMPTLLVKPEDAAHLLQISRARLYQLMATGDIKSIKSGRSRRISRAALNEYVAQLERESSGHGA